MADQQTFWVAITGNAFGDGSQGNPFDSIARAQQAVRDVLSSGPQQQDIVVKIHGGTYELPQTLTFTAADSGNSGHVVRYEAVDGEHPVISGGRAVTGWTAVDNPGLGLAPGATLWKAHVGTGVDTRQLYIDGERATRAETNVYSTLENPVYPEGFRPTFNGPVAPGVSGIEYIVSDQNSGNWRDPTTWTNVGDIEAVIDTQWKMMTVPLASVTAPSASIASLIAPYQIAAGQPVTPVGLITMDDSQKAWTNANLFQASPTAIEVSGIKVLTLNGDFATQGMKAGMLVSGANIAAGTTITSVDHAHNQITLSTAPTVPGTVALDVPLTVTDASTGEAIGQHPGIWSFWRVSKFENAYQFLDQAKEWYLDRSTGDLYLVGGAGFNPNAHDIQLPVLEKLIAGNGTANAPVANIAFNGLTFKYATWLDPNSAHGYVSDQSGFHVVGDGHEVNLIGHVKDLERTPGNISFSYGQNISLTGNNFFNLGAVAVDFTGGAQNNHIDYNVFHDVSSAAIQVGGISALDARPNSTAGITQGNQIVGNVIQHVGVEFIDAAGIFVGFAQNTNIQDNFISDVPWSGIAMGWGWGLMDQGGFAGLPGAAAGMWGPGGQPYTTPTIMQGNRIVGNVITNFLEQVWDGGAIYTTGFQGTSLANGTYIADNYAHGKRPDGGGNIFYTDGGSRYLTLEDNIAIGNAQGKLDFGAPFSQHDPLNGLIYDHGIPVMLNPFAVFPALANGQAYGGTIGGCVTYGDIAYIGNIWTDLWTTNPFGASFNPSDWPNNPLFYDPGAQYWTPSLTFIANKIISQTLFDSLLVFPKATAMVVARVDDHDDVVSFGLQSMRDGHTEILLGDAHGSDHGALAYDASADAFWLSSEGKALGSVRALPELMKAGVWLPTATHDGRALALTSVELGANSLLATFEGGYKADFSLGGTRSLLTGDVGEHTAVTVKRLASYDNGLAFYEADRNNGGVTLDGRTFSPGQAGYLEAALAKAKADGLALDPGRLPGYGQQEVLKNLPIDPAKNYAVLVIVNNDPHTMFSSYAKANPNGDVQILTFGEHGRGVTYGIEDTSLSSGHSDRDYNDLLVTFNFNNHDPI